MCCNNGPLSSFRLAQLDPPWRSNLKHIHPGPIRGSPAFFIYPIITKHYPFTRVMCCNNVANSSFGSLDSVLPGGRTSNTSSPSRYEGRRHSSFTPLLQNITLLQGSCVAIMWQIHHLARSTRSSLFGRTSNMAANIPHIPAYPRQIPKKPPCIPISPIYTHTYRRYVCVYMGDMGIQGGLSLHLPRQCSAPPQTIRPAHWGSPHSSPIAIRFPKKPPYTPLYIYITS